MRVSFTMFFFPAMLALLIMGFVLLVQGFRQKNRMKMFAALLFFVLVWACVSLLMEFITRV